MGIRQLYIFAVLLFGFLFGPNANAQENVSASATIEIPVQTPEEILAPDTVTISTGRGLKSVDLPRDGLVVIYFFQTNRCPDCLVIEATATDLLETEFEDAIVDSLIFWQPVEFELPENRNFQLAYDLDVTMIVLSRRVDGKEVDWVMLTEIWDLVEETISLADYIRYEIEMFLYEEEN